MGLNATWSMAVGGMVGGGIFSVLGVIISLAGNMAWLSFILAGLIALATAISYSNLTNKFEEGGGTFTYIKEINHEGLAGGLSWLLMIGYILTLSVYAFTFGHYLETIISLGPIFARVSSLIIILVFMIFNLRGVGEASWIEIVTVWGKLAILLGIAGVGLWQISPEILTVNSGGTVSAISSAIIGAATIFMAYEGFQLITYDYQEIKNPTVTIKKAEILAVIAVIVVYIVVTFGTMSLVSREILLEKKEVVIAIAGRKVFGVIGMVIASIGALFSTGSAINSTIFASSRLVKKVINDGELPEIFAKENDSEIPQRAIYIISGTGATLALFGSLTRLVEAASFIFLFTFAVVNIIAFKEIKENKIIAVFGASGAFAAVIMLILRFIKHSPLVLLILGVLIITVTVVQTWIYSN